MVPVFIVSGMLSKRYRVFMFGFSWLGCFGSWDRGLINFWSFGASDFLDLLVMGEVYLDLFTFPIYLFGVFVLERGGISGVGSLFQDLDREWSLIRTDMVSIGILRFRGCYCVEIVPEVNFFAKN